MNRFLGDSPVRVILKLIVVSFIVGLVMSAFNWTPMDIYYWAREFAYRIWYMGFDAFGRFAGYIVLGAAVVVPVFLILRILSFRKD